MSKEPGIGICGTSGVTMHPLVINGCYGKLIGLPLIRQPSLDIITERKLTQAMAATVLGIDQPKVSALMRGRHDGFSSDRLFRFLNALDRDVEIVIKPKRRDAKHGSIHVVVP